MTSTVGRAPNAAPAGSRPLVVDAGRLGAGAAVSVVAAYLLLLAVTRQLGDEAAAPISLLWSYWLFATAAIGVPLQQWMVRSASAGVSAGIQRRTITIAALATAAVAALVFFAGFSSGDRLFSDGRLVFSAGLAGITLGALAMGYTRGRFAAAGRYGWVSAVLAGENSLRLAVAVPLLVLGAGARSIAGVLVLGAAIALIAPLIPAPRPSGTATGPALGLMASLSVVAVLPQLLFAAVPYALTLRAAPESIVTAAFVLLAVLRIPNVLTNAIGLRLLDDAAELTTGDPARLDGHRAKIARLVPLAAVGVAVVSTLVLVPVVDTLFGLEGSLPSLDVALLAFGAILAVGVTLLIVLLAAEGDVRRVVIAGVGAIAVGAVCVALLSDPVRAATLGFAGAEVVFFAGCLAPDLRRPANHGGRT